MNYEKAKIEVVGVYPDGTAKVYGWLDQNGRRRHLETMHFSNYGKAKLWADEYEESQLASQARN